jgi:hypothetical protein
MLHDDAAGIACQASRRFRGNVFAIRESRLPRHLWIGERRSVDMNDDLIPLARSSRIDTVMEGGLREQRQGIGRLLLERRRFRGNVHRVGIGERPIRALIECLARGAQCLDQELAGLGLEPSADRDHTVVIPIHVQGPTTVPSRRFTSLGLLIYAPPATYDSLDVLRRTSSPHREQALFRRGSPHASQRTDLRIRQLTVGERFGQPR